MTRIVLALAILLPLTGLSAQQADGTFVLRGRVLADASGTPLHRARVVLVRDDGAEPVLTDREGRFALSVPASPFTLSLSKAGYAPRRVAVDALPSEGLTIGLPRGAAVTGVAIDELGDPVAGIGVRVRRVDEPPDSPAGELVYVAETDDLGEFRIGSLPAGRYGVSLDPAAFHSQTMAVERPALQGLGLSYETPFSVSVFNRQAQMDAQAIVPLRAGSEAAVTLDYRPGKDPIESVTSWATGFEAGSRAAQDSLGQATPPASAKETGVVRGRISAPNGRAVGGALVRLTGTPARGRVRAAATDARGAYEISGVVPGNYRLSVTKSGLTPIEYGQDRAMQQGRTLAVRAGERLERIDVAFPRGGVITGAILDEGGEPLEGISVHVWQARFGGGRTVVTPVTGVRARRTDDRGHYRIHGLLPGSYYVVASVVRQSRPSTGNAARLQSPDGNFVFLEGPGMESLASPLRVFYPGRSSIAEATALQIDIAGHVGGADMPFVPPTGARVSGIATSSTGRPVSGPVLLTVSGRSGAPTLPPQTVRTDEAGRFEFTDVAPGDYVVQAIVPGGSEVFTSRTTNGATFVVERLQAGRSGPSTQPEFGMQYVTVSNADAATVAITTRPGSTLTGRLVLEGETGMLPGSFQLSAVPADFDLAPVVSAQIAPRALIKDDWTFEMSNLIGPSRLSVSAPDGWWLKSATVDGLNAADEPITFGTAEQSRGNVEIVLSSRSATLSGRVRDGRDAPVTDYSVIVFATDSQRWYDRSRYLKLARPSQDGRFDVSGLPPGEYWVAAVDAIAGDTGYGEWQNPDVLNGLTPGARRIALAEGQRAAIELRVMRR